MVAFMNLTRLRNDPVYATANLVTNTAVVGKHNRLMVSGGDFNTIFSGVIPILVLSYLNSRIIRAMKHSNKIHNKICSNERYIFIHYWSILN